MYNKLGVAPGWPAGTDGAADGMFDGMFARESPGEAAGGGLPGQEDLTEQDDFGFREGVAPDGHRNRRCARAGGVVLSHGLPACEASEVPAAGK